MLKREREREGEKEREKEIERKREEGVNEIEINYDRPGILHIIIPCFWLRQAAHQEFLLHTGETKPSLI